MGNPRDHRAGDAPGRAGYTVTAERKLVRRPAGRLLWVAVVLVPVALTALLGWARADTLEASLAGDVRQALRAEGLTGVRLSVDGRQVAARVPTGRDPQGVVAVASRVPGVMSVTTRAVFGSRAEARACRGIATRVHRATGRQRIGFAGASASLTGEGQERVRAAAALLRACPAATAVVGGHTDSSVGDPGALSLERARVIVGALVRAGVAEERLAARGYGDQFEVADATTPTARAANQRGSIVVERR